MFGWRKGGDKTPAERPQPQPTVLGAPDQGPNGNMFGSSESYTPPTLRTVEPSPELAKDGVKLGESAREVGQQVLRNTEIGKRQ